MSCIRVEAEPSHIMSDWDCQKLATHILLFLKNINGNLLYILLGTLLFHLVC